MPNTRGARGAPKTKVIRVSHETMAVLRAAARPGEAPGDVAARFVKAALAAREGLAPETVREAG